MKPTGGNGSTNAIRVALAVIFVAGLTYSAAVAILAARHHGLSGGEFLPDIRLALAGLKADTASEILVRDRILLTGDIELEAIARTLEKKSRKILREVEDHFSDDPPRALRTFREARNGYDLHYDRLFDIISGGGSRDFSRSLKELSGFVDTMMTSMEELLDRYEGAGPRIGGPGNVVEPGLSDSKGISMQGPGKLLSELAIATSLFSVLLVGIWWWLARITLGRERKFATEIGSIGNLPGPGRLPLERAGSTDEVRTFVNELLDLVEFGARERDKLSGRISNLQEEERRRSRRDTEELREKNQELYYIKEYYMGIVESITDGIILLDDGRRIASANKVAFSTFVLGAGDMGRIGLETLFPDYEAEVIKALSALPGEKVVRLKRLRRGEKWFDLSFHPSYGTTGNFDGATVVLEDVTMVTELQERVSSVERLASLGRLSAGVAHEIKNPLAGIQIALELLLERGGLATWDREKLGEIQLEVDRLDGIVNSMLDLARPSSGEGGACDPAEVMDKVLRFLSSRMERSGITLVREFGGAGQCRFDETRLQQVFLNVVVNAVEALGQCSGNCWIRVSSIRDGEDIVFTVADGGPGMIPEMAQKVFEPFFTTKSRGTGLGLAITHNILRDFGGDITFDSLPERGTTVAITLKGVE